MVLLENIPCPICNEAKNSTLFKTKDFRLRTSDDVFSIVKCNACGFIFLNPRSAQEEIANFYPKPFYKPGHTWYYKIFGILSYLSREKNANLLKKYKSSGKLLDIGCGTGEFIYQMQKRGFDACGIEISGNIKDYLLDSLKNRVYSKNLEECDFSQNSFDIITMFQSFEHVHEIKSLLREIRRILKPDGVMYISVPNANFFEYRLFGPYAYTLDVPRHLYFFTKGTLDRIMSENGFKIKCFTRNIFYELLITPTSVYHGVWDFLIDRRILSSKLLRFLSFVPLVILGFILHILFIKEGHILELVLEKAE